ncbi:unnamed protein product [Prorocentrum cordatum]|uniref:Uncharacterized protein n=1 Tax=Prorocentrum cordatum TaxID=2364126 RepID=A0ABN9WLR7_9DINO|nr:unnamed protein product [Polarella glacialis]
MPEYHAEDKHLPLVDSALRELLDVGRTAKFTPDARPAPIAWLKSRAQVRQLAVDQGFVLPARAG